MGIEVNEKTVEKRALAILDDYQLKRDLSMRDGSVLSCVTYDGMPKIESFENHTESNIVKALTAQEYCDIVNESVDSIRDEDLRMIIKLTYINPLGTVRNIALRLGMCRTKYYNLRHKALYKFGLVCSLVSLQK